MEWMQYAATILTGLAVAIPLVIKLIEYVQKAAKEKNWNSLLVLIMNLMEEAEEKFSDGASRKEWAMGMVESSAKSINYDVDLDEVSKLIDALCSMSNIVNKNKSGD